MARRTTMYLYFFILIASVAADATISSITLEKHRTALRLRPNLLVGKHNGQILRCAVDYPDACEQFYKADSDITSLTNVFGGTIYVALYSGDLLKCERDCEVIGKVSEGMNRLTIGIHYNIGGEYHFYLHVGLHNGTVLRSEVGEFKWWSVYNVGEDIHSLMELDGFIYAGTANGQLWQCKTECKRVYTMNSTITGLTYLENSIYAITINGYIWKCAKNPFECESALSNDVNIIDLETVDGRLYVVKCRSHISVYNWGDVRHGSVLAPYEGISSIAFA